MSMAKCIAGNPATRQLPCSLQAVTYPADVLFRLQQLRGRHLGKTSDTLTRSEIAGAVRRNLGIPQSESVALVDAILEAMLDALGRGENVKIASFGTFLPRDKVARVGRNPKTGEAAPISARRVLKFRASQSLRDRVAGIP